MWAPTSLRGKARLLAVGQQALNRGHCCPAAPRGSSQVTSLAFLCAWNVLPRHLPAPLCGRTLSQQSLWPLRFAFPASVFLRSTYLQGTVPLLLSNPGASAIRTNLQDFPGPSAQKTPQLSAEETSTRCRRAEGGCLTPVRRPCPRSSLEVSSLKASTPYADSWPSGWARWHHNCYLR